MKTVSFFHKDTGVVHGSRYTTTDDASIAANTPPDHVPIVAALDHLSQRVDIGKMTAEREAHRASHRAYVESMRERYVPSIPGNTFQEPREQLFMPTLDVVVDYVPEQPSPEHEWNTTTRRWCLSEAAQKRAQERIDALAQIATLEAAQLRPMRELALNSQNAEARQRLEAIETEIAALRASL